jgi:1-acyl-sn-glycerol-3-phosphate acyltransferase
MLNRKYLEALVPAFQKLSDYHHHSVVGMEHIPHAGPVIVAVNHSLATYDISLLSLAIYKSKGRITRSLADRLFFKIPYLNELTTHLGVVEGNHENAQQLLQDGEIIVVAPGGMLEGLKSSQERYQILWDKRMGFAKLSARTGVPIVLAVCPKADDIFDVYSSRLTKWAYQNFKLPLPFARGLGISLIPRPVKLTHFLSPPMQPPVLTGDKKKDDRLIKQYHARLVRTTEDLIGKAIAHRDH